MKAFEFSWENISGITEWIDENKIKDGNGMDIIAYVRNDNGELIMYDAYLMIDTKQESYVELCKWYDNNDIEVSRNNPSAECVVAQHCPITKTLE